MSHFLKLKDTLCPPWTWQKHSPKWLQKEMYQNWIACHIFSNNSLPSSGEESAKLPMLRGWDHAYTNHLLHHGRRKQISISFVMTLRATNPSPSVNVFGNIFDRRKKGSGSSKRELQLDDGSRFDSHISNEYYQGEFEEEEEVNKLARKGQTRKKVDHHPLSKL